jgi:hypothetical protein
VKLESNTKATYPVYRAAGGIIEALPEVRVEESRQARQVKLREWLKEHGDEVRIVSENDDRIVLEPVSGAGQDALQIANQLAAEIGPELAQPRFIRITPRPDSRSRQ